MVQDYNARPGEQPGPEEPPVCHIWRGEVCALCALCALRAGIDGFRDFGKGENGRKKHAGKEL
jgi:hypothetical protein